MIDGMHGLQEEQFARKWKQLAVFILSGIYRKRAGGVTLVIGSDMDTLNQKHDPDANDPCGN